MVIEDVPGMLDRSLTPYTTSSAITWSEAWSTRGPWCWVWVPRIGSASTRSWDGSRD